MNMTAHPQTLPLEEAVHAAMLAPAEAGPVWLRDSGDDVAFGAPGDGTALLWALLDLGAVNALVIGLVDAAAVAMAGAAEVGTQLDLNLGGASGSDTGFPLDVHAVVRGLGQDGNGGRTVLLACDGRYEHAVEVLVSERPICRVTEGLFLAHGIAPSEKRLIAVKGEVASDLLQRGQGLIVATTPGPTNSRS